VSAEKVAEYLERADWHAKESASGLAAVETLPAGQQYRAVELARVHAVLADYWLRRAIDERPR
jgi:hypothetical protein